MIATTGRSPGGWIPVNIMTIRLIAEQLEGQLEVPNTSKVRQLISSQLDKPNTEDVINRLCAAGMLVVEIDELGNELRRKIAELQEV